jgi:DedD protein
MAERSNATSKKNQDAAQDVSTLQKRGRRRLVGAIALVLLAVIVLPMVFDPEPRPPAPTVNIRIPNEEGSKFTPKAAPKPAPSQAAAPVVAPEPAKTEPKTAVAAVEKAVPKPEPKAEPKPAEKKAPPPAPKPAEKAPAPPKAAEKPPAPAPAPAPSGGEKYVAQVGAFASAEKVKEITDQLTSAKLAHYVETVATAKGPVTRIRLGPFDSKEAAEKARERAKSLGLNAANPILK